ncbi:response regulator [Acuticoccus sediminis]|nr:response regulator [Acuticoccus sediminis]
MSEFAPRDRAPRILIVEDEMFIGLELSMIVEEAGFEPIGPVADLDGAHTLLSTERPDIAILDINLGPNVTSAPVAETLSALAVPFVYLSGYSANYVRDNMPPAPLLSKPVDPNAVLSEIRRALTRETDAGGSPQEA